jgi:hypothetical protein
MYIVFFSRLNQFMEAKADHCISLIGTESQTDDKSVFINSANITCSNIEIGPSVYGSVIISLTKTSPDGVEMVQHKTRLYCHRCSGCAICTIYCGVAALRAFCLRGPSMKIISNNILSMKEAIQVIWSSSLDNQETMCMNDKKWSVHTKSHHFEIEHQLLCTRDDILSYLEEEQIKV